MSDQLPAASSLPNAVRVLVVEDDPAIRAAFVRVLSCAGYCVAACTSGEQARDLLHRGERYSVIVTDRTMPGMDGAELLPIVREYDSDTQLVIVTGHADCDESFATPYTKSFSYLLKPVNLPTLRSTVHAAAAACERSRRQRL